jgi:hypothetical protein
MVAGHALVEDPVTRLFRRMRIEDHDRAEALLAQIGDEFGRGGKALGAPREGLELVLVVDVQPQRVGRHLLLSEGVGQAAHARLRVVAPAALVVAQRPARRKRRAAGELRVAAHDVARVRTGDHRVVELAAVGAEAQQSTALAANVEAAAVGVVEEHAMRAALAQHEVERHRGIDRVGGVVVAVGVAVPHHVVVAAQCPTALVEGAVLLAEAVDVVGVAQLLPHPHSRAVVRDAATGVIGVDDVAVGVLDGEAERSGLNFDAQGVGGDQAAESG